MYISTRSSRFRGSRSCILDPGSMLLHAARPGLVLWSERDQRDPRRYRCLRPGGHCALASDPRRDAFRTDHRQRARPGSDAHRCRIGRGQQTVPNYLLDRAGDIPILGSIGTPNLEAIGAAHPDLILVDGTSVKNNDTETLTALGQIAPVFFTTQSGGDWRETFALTADALGVLDQADVKLAEFDQHVASVSARLKDAGYLDQTYSVVRWQGDSAGLILKELPAGQALTALGMKRPANQDRDGEGHSEPVSLENIDQIDADWIFFGTLGKSSVNNPSAGGSTGVEASAAALDEAKATVGFDSLGAVQANHVIPVDGSLWTSTGGYLLMDGIVSSIEAQFVPAS